MKIKLLQQREDFDAIFRSSLSRFLIDFFGRKATLVAPGKGEMGFRLNAALNIIYPTSIGAQHLDAATAEFRYAPGAARRLAQTAYCRFAVRPPLNRFLSPRSFDLIDAPLEMRPWIFLPGNHSVRILDTANDRCIVFGKDGFDSRFFLRDAEVRQSFADLAVPLVQEIDPQARWYCEARVTGLPLNRLARPDQSAAALAHVHAALVKLRKRTATEVIAQEHADRLATAAITIIDGLSESLGPVGDRLAGIAAAAKTCITIAAPFEVTLCRSHGDFQPANILTDGERSWLIDWEYSDIRCAWYDDVVFKARTRFSDGLSDRLRKVLQDMRQQGGTSAAGYFQHGPAGPLLALFLLEELVLKLSEVAAPGINDKTSSLVSWAHQVTPVLADITEISKDCKRS